VSTFFALERWEEGERRYAYTFVIERKERGEAEILAVKYNTAAETSYSLSIISIYPPKQNLKVRNGK
jgi:hypothetical protein